MVMSESITAWAQTKMSTNNMKTTDNDCGGIKEYF
jgi:hypothetical protein